MRDKRRNAMTRIATTRRGLLLAAGLGLAAPALAQSYPSGPVRIVVPFGPGGGVDIIARTIADEWIRLTGATIIVENRPGAGGNLGSAAAARATPDGHTLLLASNSNSYNDLLYRDAGYRPAQDLAPVIQIGRVPIVLVAYPGLEARNVQELLALARARPGSLSFASFGFGSSGHLLFELFTRRTGISAVHVPYRNGTLYPDLMAGRTQLVFNNQLGVMSHIRAGQMRVLGVASDQRSPQLPDVPTFAEQGVEGISADVWWGVMVPAATPAPAIAALNGIVNRVLQAEAVRTRIESLGAQPVGGSVEHFTRFFAAERATWQRVITDANIRLD
jgi:tripartite-type tricarboxylate transporter receptor subunit TctC